MWWNIIPRPFSKKSKLSISLDGSIIQSFIQLVFTVYQLEDYQNILKLSCKPLAFTSFKAFPKTRKRSVTSLSAPFSERFLKKNISLIIFYYLTKFHCLIAFSSRDIAQYLSLFLLTRL